MSDNPTRDEYRRAFDGLLPGGSLAGAGGGVAYAAFMLNEWLMDGHAADLAELLREVGFSDEEVYEGLMAMARGLAMDPAEVWAAVYLPQEMAF